MNALLIELHFLPSIEYFCALRGFEKIILEKHEHYMKQSYRNRCYILTSHGTERLTIPLVAAHKKILVTEIKIDYTTRWQTAFWRTVESSYAKAPFFEHYADALQKEIVARHETLYELNFRLLNICLGWLGWNKTIIESTAYDKKVDEHITDLRSVVSAKKDFAQREWYHPKPYQQVFGSAFTPNLSLLDLIFCEGPHGTTLVNASSTGN